MRTECLVVFDPENPTDLLQCVNQNCQNCNKLQNQNTIGNYGKFNEFMIVSNEESEMEIFEMILSKKIDSDKKSIQELRKLLGNYKQISNYCLSSEGDYHENNDFHHQHQFFEEFNGEMRGEDENEEIAQQNTEKPLKAVKKHKLKAFMKQIKSDQKQKRSDKNTFYL